MKKNNIKLGDMILIPLNDEDCAVGKIIFLSKVYKNVILFNIYPLVANMKEILEPPVEDFTSRLLIYTAINPIIADMWKKIGNCPVSKDEREMSTRIVAGSVWIEDNYIRPATENDLENLPVMGVGGYILVQNKARKYLETLQLLNMNSN